MAPPCLRFAPCAPSRNQARAITGLIQRSPKKQHGFTLVELLVAITIMAIIAVLGWRGLDSIVRARVSLNADLDQTRGLQLAFAQMQSDCAHIVSAADIGNHTPLAADDNRLTLVRFVYGEDQPGRVQVISYRVRDGVLTRRESVATRDLNELNAAWTDAMNDAGTQPAVTLQSDVGQMTVRSWVPNAGWRAGVDSQTRQSTPGMPHPGVLPQAPTGLEVSLQLRGRSSKMVKIFLLGAV